MSAIRHTIRGLQSMAEVTVHADGIIFNGLRYQNPVLAGHINDKALVFTDVDSGLVVFINGEFACAADVESNMSQFPSADDMVGREALVLTGEYQGAAGIVMQVNCDAHETIYHVRLYGGDELHSYVYSELYFNDNEELS